MPKLMIAVMILFAVTINCSVAYSSRKPATKVSKISFMLKRRAPEQPKDRLPHGRR